MNAPLLTAGAIEALQTVHATKAFRLATSVGLDGQAHVNGNPQALVTELLRLARLGARLRAEADRCPRRRLAAVVRQFEVAP